MAQQLELTEQMRQALEEFGTESAVFQQWSKIPQGYRTTIDGTRMTMQLSTQGTILTRWYGPKALEALLAEPINR